MIKTIIARHDEGIYNNYIGPTIRRYQVAICDVHDQPGQQMTLPAKYNFGINAYMQKGGIAPDDVMVFIHEDVRILDPQFARKLEIVFAQKREVGMLGLCGATEYTQKGAWHLVDNRDSLRGHLMQEFQGQTNHNVYGNKIGYFDDLCVVDGFFFAIRGKLFLEGMRFDMTLSKVDFYDMDISLQVLEQGYKVAIADILLQHRSEGAGVLKEEWKQDLPKMIAKWTAKGKTFPITPAQFELRNFDEEVEDAVEIEV